MTTFGDVRKEFVLASRPENVKYAVIHKKGDKYIGGKGNFFTWAVHCLRYGVDRNYKIRIKTDRQILITQLNLVLRGGHKSYATSFNDMALKHIDNENRREYNKCMLEALDVYIDGRKD